MSIEKYKKFLPDNINSSDIYIVAYPKSGITWLSTLIANVNLIESGLKLTATHYNIQQLIPDIHMNPYIPPQPVWKSPPFRFIKSHLTHCPYYNHVIYLVRNPLSVMNSFYHRNIALNLTKNSMLEFIKDENTGLQNWTNHVHGWLFKGDSSQRLHLIKYEELHSNAFYVLKTLYKNLGIHVQDESINKAIEISSFESMKESEALYKKHNPNITQQFVREGKIKQTDIEDEIKTYILNETDFLLQHLDYQSFIE